MEQQNPAPETDTAREPAKINKGQWPWIVGGMAFAIITLYNGNLDKDKEIARLNAANANDKDKVVQLAVHVADQQDRVTRKTDYLVRLTNDTSIRRRIDSAGSAQ